jgi:TM2 domain-containing membrane protein YozV
MEEKIIVKKPPKSPTLAGILACFFPIAGAGQLYNRQYLKGILYAFIFIGLVTMQEHAGAQPFLGMLLGAFYIFQIFDSVHTAKSINRRALLGEEVEKEEEEKIAQVAKSGSVFWGVVLIALGGILLLANFEVLSYESIFDFWPVVVIVIGLKLVVGYFSKRK